MKIAMISDIHLMEHTPKSRLDNVPEAQIAKILEMAEWCNDNKVDLVLLGGDIFETAYSWHMLSPAIKAFGLFKAEIRAVFGNHDLLYHNMKNYHKTPLYALSVALDNFGILGEEPEIFAGTSIDDHEDIELCGGHWELDYVKPKINDSYKILLVHEMVIDQKLWEGQEGYTRGTKMLELGYDLVVSGDNHQQFTLKSGRGDNRKRLVNSGGMLRKTKAQMEHTPAFYVIDTETDKLTKHPFDVSGDVFNLELIAKEEMQEEQLTEFSVFIEGIMDGAGHRIDFKKALSTALRKIDDKQERKQLQTFIGDLDVK